MLSKIFKRAEPPAARLVPSPVKIVDEERLAVQEAAQLSAKAEWETRLQAAMGSDNALLAVANAAPLVDIKHAAVLALTSEAALKIAEREFRSHDRRVHRTAKQRYEALVVQRETCEQAHKLIAAAAALTQESLIPSNRLVELGHAWSALDASLLEESQKSDFVAVLAKLTALVRERSEMQRSARRWIADANQALARLNVSCAEVTTGSTQWNELATAIGTADKAARILLSAAPAMTAPPEGGEIAALVESLRAVLHQAEQIETRLGILNDLYHGNQSNVVQPGDAEIIPAADIVTHATPTQRWHALTSPVADKRFAQALNTRFDEWVRSKDDVRKTQQAEKKQRARERSNAALQAHNESVRNKVKFAEAALAAGHLAETGKHLAAIKEEMEEGEVESVLQARVNALQAEYAHLKGWQHWGGGRVRDDLVQEAADLARVAASADESGAAKLPIKQHADAIEQLRTRWKELDRLGAATSRESWQRFDDALKTAYRPVAEHLDKLNAARQENRDARKILLAALDSVRLADTEKGEIPEWREVARALANFQVEWRKLGPVEHTVSHKVRDALLEQMNASVARLEAPLQEARRIAQLARTEFISRAKALAVDAQGRDVVAKVRELQAEWQQQARVLPLAREVENALWTQFKEAIDGVFSLRDAVFKARDADLKANQAAREALIERLCALNQDTPPADIKRSVAEAEMEWRKAGEAPKSEVARLEAQFRAACGAALQHVAASAQRIWNATFDALLAKVALCEEIEDNALDIIPIADVESRWGALPVLPQSWEQPLNVRFRAVIENGSDAPSAGAVLMPNETLDSILLRLEAALAIPSPAAFQAARQTLKLQAMKSVLEGGRATTVSKIEIEKMTTCVLGSAHTDAVQRQRLDTIIAALRSGGP